MGSVWERTFTSAHTAFRVFTSWSDDPAVQAYYDFMRSYQMTKLYRVYFSRVGSFAKLQAALGYEPDHVWTEDERLRFISGFTFFTEAFKKLGGESLPVTAADALLVWLRVYPFEQLKTTPAAELVKTLRGAAMLNVNAGQLAGWLCAGMYNQ